MEKIVDVTNSLLELKTSEQEYLWNSGWKKVGTQDWTNVEGKKMIQERAVEEQRKRDLYETKP